MRAQFENTLVVRDLMAGCPVECRSDYNKIASAIMNGTSKEEILDMPETNNWPETYSWLKSKLSA